MTYIDVKEKTELLDLTKKWQRKFHNEKLGRQEEYREHKKMFLPVTETLQQQQQTMMLEYASMNHLAITSISQIGEPPINRDILRLGKISVRYLNKFASWKEYDFTYGWSQ